MSDKLPKPSAGQETVQPDQQHENNTSGWRASFSHDGKNEVRGITYGGVARGAISMSNVYLANALIHLACKAGGGFDETGTRCINPNVTVYGMKPFALVSNIAVLASILACVMMPPAGAIIDYTSHRKTVGICTAIGMVAISALQVYTVENTWFIMAILQSIVFMIYQIQIMALTAYFPEIARDTGAEKINDYSTTWSMYQFFSQAAVNSVIIVSSVVFRLGTVHTSMLSQGLVSVVCAIALIICWRLLPNRPPKHRLRKGRSIMLAGFRQNWRTCKKIWKHYDKGLRWWMLSTVFGEAAASAVGTTAVIFLTGNLKLSPFQIGIFFEIALVGVVFGTKIGMVATRWTDPKISLILSELGLAFSIIIGVWSVQGVEHEELTYIWGFSIGIFLGWFYPTENVFFSLCLPSDQETELSGFYQFCSEIFGWFPPLVFSIMVESNITLAWALTTVAAIFFISIFFLLLCSPWEEIVEQAQIVLVDFSPDSEELEIRQDAENKNDENVEPEKVATC